MSTPTYLYKIVPSSTPPPTPLPERLPVSELDSVSDFLHLSTAGQIPETLRLFFKDAEKVYILRIEYKNVENDTKWENSRTGALGGVGEENVYPHIYNGLRLGCAEIESIIEWEQDSKGWDTTLASEKAKLWLIY